MNLKYNNILFFKKIALIVKVLFYFYINYYILIFYVYLFELKILTIVLI
jgi:hypothetical protein